jgi:predicted MPP superfamily phosphohydrolase
MTALYIALPLVLLGIYLTTVWYVATRLPKTCGWSPRWPLRLGIIALVVGATVGMMSGATSPQALAGIAYVIGGYVFILHVYLVAALLVLHVIESAWRPLKIRSGFIALGVAATVTVAGTAWAHRFSVKEVTIPLAGLKEELVVMHLADVHLGHHRGADYLARIVEETNRRKPDIILINGDLVDSNSALRPEEFAPLSRFRAPAYFVGGNHENYIDSAQALELIARQGVRVLHNEVIESRGVRFVGLDYMNADENTFNLHPSADKRTIKSVLAALDLPHDKPAVLFHHSPAGLRYAAEKGFALMLAGHTHGGQVFPGTWLAALIYPFKPGLHQLGDMKVFLSQGAGTYMVRLRLGTTNEIDVLRLVPSQAKDAAAQRME